jgi:hypothetical protein
MRGGYAALGVNLVLVFAKKPRAFNLVPAYRHQYFARHFDRIAICLSVERAVFRQQRRTSREKCLKTAWKKPLRGFDCFRNGNLGH